MKKNSLIGKNNYAKYSVWSLLFLFLLSYFLTGSWLMMILAPLVLIPLGLAIKALLDYRKDNLIGGKNAAIIVIVLSILYIILMVIVVLVLKYAIGGLLKGSIN